MEADVWRQESLDGGEEQDIKPHPSGPEIIPLLENSWYFYEREVPTSTAREMRGGRRGKMISGHIYYLKRFLHKEGLNEKLFAPYTQTNVEVMFGALTRDVVRNMSVIEVTDITTKSQRSQGLATASNLRAFSPE